MCTHALICHFYRFLREPVPQRHAASAATGDWLTMRWPWSRKPSADRLIVSLAGQQLAYLQARSTDGGGYEITRAGVVLQGSDTLQAFQSRVQS